MGKIIDGKQIALSVKDRVKKEVEILKEKGILCCLCVVLVGDDEASKIYVRNKKRACHDLGIESREILLSKDITQKELLDVVEELNCDEKVNGILVQLPLPKHLDEFSVINAINPLKDVDCFSVSNVGKIVVGKSLFLPCTPSGIVDLLDSTGLDFVGKNCVIIGRSNIVGKPMSLLMLQKNATVTVCHSKTRDLEFFTREADVLIAAVGRAKFVKKDMVKKGAVVVDVGINRMENGKICGDVDFDEVFEVASYITPVPGGVGPMTIAKLMENTLLATKLQNGILKI